MTSLFEILLFVRFVAVFGRSNEAFDHRSVIGIPFPSLQLPRGIPILAQTYYVNPNQDSKTNSLLDEETSAEGEKCVAADGRKGSCYETSRCVRRGGTPIGRCKDPDTVCCIFHLTCGDVIKESPAYARSPGYPRPYSKEQLCKIRIEKINNSVCQYRLDFKDFDVARPVGGNCTQDVLVITGQDENNRLPRICGLNTGQHIYAEVKQSGELVINLMMIGNYQRKFNILVTQIDCRSEEIAPSHCLQYHEGNQGELKSFNYDEHSVPVRLQGYPNNLDYAICLRKMPGFCSITYQLPMGRSGSLSVFAVGVTGTAVTTSAPLTVECQDDYLVIRDTRLCSTVVGPLPSIRSTREVNVTSPILLTDFTSGPFIVRFVSNAVNNARGFRLHYHQHPCNTLQ